MTWAALCKILFAEYQLHIFSVLTTCMILWFRMDKRHSNETIKNNLKFEDIDGDIQEIKGDVKEIRKEVRDCKDDTDKKITNLADVTQIKLEEKYKVLYGEKEKKQTETKSAQG